MQAAAIETRFNQVVWAIAVLLLATSTAHAQMIVDPGDTVIFDEADDKTLDFSSCSGANVCGAQGLEQEASLQVLTIFVAGIDETKYAQTTLENYFELSGDADLERVLTANLSGEVSWSGRVGILAAAGSTDATINVKVRLTDLTDGRVVAQREIVESSCSTDFAGGGCLRTPEGSANYNLSVDLVRGHEYRFDLIGRCESFIGLAATEVGCEFFYGSNGVSRGPIRLSVARDFEAEIDLLREELNALKQEFDDHGHVYLTGNGTGHNNTAATTSVPAMCSEASSSDGACALAPAEDTQSSKGSKKSKKSKKKKKK